VWLLAGLSLCFLAAFILHIPFSACWNLR
jgi:hypothetical protein